MCELSYKERMVVDLLALDSDAVAAFAFRIHSVPVIDAEKHFGPLSRDQPHF